VLGRCSSYLPTSRSSCAYLAGTIEHTEEIERANWSELAQETANDPERMLGSASQHGAVSGEWSCCRSTHVFSR
jgi:LAS superfamily LD-carboxypeptidase LdcB